MQSIFYDVILKAFFSFIHCIYIYNFIISEKCKDVKCPPGQSCIYDQDGFSYCIESDCDEVLTKTCPTNDENGDEVSKVCGLDNITYKSMCHLRQASCKTHQVLLKRYDGACGGISISCISYLIFLLFFFIVFIYVYLEVRHNRSLCKL